MCGWTRWGIGLILCFWLVGCGKETTAPESPTGGLLFSVERIDFGVGALRQAVILTNKTGSKVDWEVVEKPFWAEVDPTQGSIWNGRHDTLFVAAKTNDLAFGTYQGLLLVRWGKNEKEIPLNLVHQPSRLEVHQNLLFFDRNVLKEHLIQNNSGTEPLIWRLASKPEWLEASKDSGMVLDVPDTLLLRVRPSGMAYGQYVDSLVVVSNVGQASITVYFLNERLREVYPGYAVGKIRVGIDTFQKILDTYGRYDWRFYDSRSFEHAIGYTWLGLRFEFYSEQLVLYPNSICTEILMEWPYDGLTEEGVGIGSLRGEVVSVYGEPQTNAQGEEIYDGLGIAFTYETDRVIRMRVFKPRTGS